jgi:hypothetical protein
MYSQLHSIAGGRPFIRNPRTRHAVVTKDPPNIFQILEDLNAGVEINSAW